MPPTHFDTMSSSCNGKRGSYPSGQMLHDAHSGWLVAAPDVCLDGFEISDPIARGVVSTLAAAVDSPEIVPRPRPPRKGTGPGKLKALW